MFVHNTIKQAHLRLLHNWSPPDDYVLVPKKMLPPEPGHVESAVEAVVAFFLLYGKLHGFPAPPQTESWEEVRKGLAEADGASPFRPRVRVGRNYIQSAFSSYWEAGAAKAFRDQNKLRRVVRDRMGLNDRGECFDISLASIRRGLQVHRHGVSFFSPFVAAQVYKLFLGDRKAPKVWDCSGGFGARLLAFTALYPEGTYFSNEPASLTRQDLGALASSLGARASIESKGSEKMEIGGDLPEEGIDLVFTSPPYFDKEEYFDEPGQCWRDYPTRPRWEMDYLLPTLKTAAAALKPEGAVALNVSRELEGAVVAAAREAGLTFLQELTLPVAADHFSRSRGVDRKSEPVLVFKKSRRPPLKPRPLWNGESDARRGPEMWVEFVPGRYAVSSRGRVSSAARGRWRRINPTLMPSGYYSVGITYAKGSRAKTKLLHQLVIRAFDGKAPSSEHTDVRHLDGDKANNSLVNLAWGTRSENMLDVLQHKKEEREPTPAEKEGESWYQGYTLDDYLLTTGLELHAEGKLSIADLVRYWRCSRETAENIVHGETRTHVERPEVPKKQKRRSTKRKAEIMALVAEGFNAAQINERLGEDLTHQAVYYYRQRPKS